jgi:hypothetical protein
VGSGNIRARGTQELVTLRHPNFRFSRALAVGELGLEKNRKGFAVSQSLSHPFAFGMNLGERTLDLFVFDEGDSELAIGRGGAVVVVFSKQLFESIDPLLEGLLGE